MINYTYLSITYMAVLDEFLLTSVQVWEKNSDLKISDKIVDFNPHIYRIKRQYLFYSIF